jgi:GTP:adenosylcobinamide-phosphate guanylyltransferase
MDNNKRKRNSRRKERKSRSAAQGPQAHIRPFPGPRPISAYAEPLDAIVLAGTDRNPTRLIAGRNKAFLDIAGRSLVRITVEALLHASTVDRVFVVGPADELDRELADLSPRVRTVPQVGQMLRNAWAGYQAAQRLRTASEDAEERPLLVLTCDIPLISPDAVDDFVARCASQDRRSGQGPHAMLVGTVEEQALLPFYPRAGQPGIIRPYVELCSGRLRLANIYVVRPQQLGHQELMETGFSYRKAKDWRNVLALTWACLSRPGGWRLAWLVLRLQATVMTAKSKGRLYRWLRRGNTQEALEAGISNLLACRVQLVDSPFGGLSLDVDDQEDYLILGLRYHEWSAWRPDRSTALRA